ncbi:hypothetical protein ACVWZA_002910 [Sphingomonas sp. UYAg733]
MPNGESKTLEHPLDGCDADECYKTMMSERTELIKARREAEDHLIKTIIQLSAALIALIAGFLAQTNILIDLNFLLLFSSVLILFILALTAGLAEQFFSSKAYQAQQIILEKYYNKEINEFSEPKANWWVRFFQLSSFSFFVLALITLACFAIIQAGKREDVRKQQSQPASSTSTSAASSSAATTANATCPSADQSRRGPGSRICN